MILVPREGQYLHPDYYELAEFFGPDMRWDWLGSDDKKGEADSARFVNNDDFIRRTHVFCYQNLGLMTQGIHRPYIARMLNMAADHGQSKFIDVGAGGGQLGLAMHTLGFQVSFADIQSVSLMYLVWRLHKRRLALPVYNLDSDTQIQRQHMAACFDVLEHLTEPEQDALLDRLDTIAEVVLVNLVHGDGTELPGLHYKLDPDRIKARVGKHLSEGFYPDAGGKPRQTLLIYGERVREQT